MARTYIVKRGDTLRKIAKARLGDAGLYLRIAEFNGMRDPNRLAVGQRLEIPSRRNLAPPALRAALPFPLPLSWDPAQQVRNLYCHRRLASVFPAVFAEIERRGLRDKLRTYGGCFNFRSKRSGSKLSTHAWGIAIDLNPETNGMGRDGDMAPGIVKVFESFGFTWGGRWSGRGKDPMHFQFCSGY